MDGIYSNPSVVSTAAIFYPLQYPSGSDNFILSSPATIISAPWGRSLIAVTTLYIVKVLLGAR